MRLEGRVALVTGASRGIGRALAVGLAREGAAVVVHYHSRTTEADEVVDSITAAGGQAVAIAGDVSVAAEVESIVAGTVERFGALDILVNNAAMVEVHRPWTEITEEHWDQVQAVNVKGCFLCFRAAYPHLRASGNGRVINIASVTFWVGHDRLAHYVASKGGVIGFTRAISREVGTDGITVNAVTPGAIETEAEQAVITDPESFRDLVEHRQSIRRRGKPEDIVGAVLYLASDEASFVTGQTINVDGGWALH
jgi:3-oxoacyl-[acyl-carrier protein] reductase